MSRSKTAVGAGLILFLTACTSTPEPVTVYDTVEVKVPIVVPCVVEVPPTAGPDFAPKNSTIFEAAQYTRARIIGLRWEINSLRKGIEACNE